MPDIVLSERQQAAVRGLFAMTPVPGSAAPDRDLLDVLDRLVPSDEITVAIADDTGLVVEAIVAPRAARLDQDPQVCDGPLMLGLVHRSRRPTHAEDLAASRFRDEVWIGFRNGPGHVSQVSLGRTSHTFDDHDVALLRMAEPALRSLLRTKPTQALPSALTTRERQVLLGVAVGRSNAEIADGLFVAPSTVSKHLENAYRKLGVTSRMAAVTVLHGGPLVGDRADRVARIDD